MNEDISLFESKGYCVVRDVIDKQLINGIKLFLNSRLKEILLKYSYIENLPNFISENFDRFSSDEKHLLSGHFDLETRLSEILVSILDAELLTSIIKEILEDDNPKLHLPPTARWVLPHSKYARVPPHQDIAYNASLKSFVVAWVPFTVLSEKCGGVRVYPKDKKNTVYNPKKGTFWLDPIPTPRTGIHCQIEIGDALLLDPYIIHQSMPNISTYPRISIDYRFYKSTINSAKHFMYINDRIIIAP